MVQYPSSFCRISCTGWPKSLPTIFLYLTCLKLVVIPWRTAGNCVFVGTLQASIGIDII
ncbi:MAG: hypothetical protein HC849_22525 [Oscillatoriales cyanobacterium RU_3_3]|nr:hypothetical protein [Oscillatoriales cyanobacterium RU_3_3]